MAKISKEEVLKIARMSHLELHDDEIPALMKQLEDVLSYAERVKEIKASGEEVSTRNVNVFRDDVAMPSDAESVLSQAPEREGTYFVVPAILDQAE
jgi:aspartyl-tRNA(Asn)/glutamyl-tRNA(Gln) amidotransferase subunit C